MVVAEPVIDGGDVVGVVVTSSPTAIDSCLPGDQGKLPSPGRQLAAYSESAAGWPAATLLPGQGYCPDQIRSHNSGPYPTAEEPFRYRHT